MTHSDLMFAPTKTAEFVEWPKTPRLLKGMTVTEKIDGTNACVVVIPQAFGTYSSGAYPNLITLVMGTELGDDDLPVNEFHVYAQSRKRMITPEKDNAGFAKWVYDNAEELVGLLGPGRHFGEWWGHGIQRTYGMKRKVFSLFNTDKWGDLDPIYEEQIGLSVVPELYRGPFDTERARDLAEAVWTSSNVAEHGWDGSGEGVCVFHHASRQVFKVTDQGDQPKGGPRDEHDNVVPLFRAMPDPDMLAA